MEDKTELNGHQRAFLLRRAHHLSAVATVGKQGATDPVVRHVDEELDHHELIKVRFHSFKDSRRTIAERLAMGTGASLVAMIGHVAILYRAAEDPAQQSIVLPGGAC